MKIPCKAFGHIGERYIPTPITEADYLLVLESNKAIQEILPHVPAEYREMLISGFCPACFKAIMNETEED